MKNRTKTSSTRPWDSKIVRQQFTFVKQVTPSASTTAVLQDLSSIGLAANSGAMTNFLDMYRYFRLNKARFEVMSDVAVTNNTCFLATFVPEGTTAPPTIAAVENNHTSPLGHTGAASNGYHAATTLTLNGDALRSVTGGKWLVTSGNATDTFLETYGSVQLLTSVSGSETFTVICRIEAEFREMVDPNTISKMLKESKNPKSPHQQGEPISNKGRYLLVRECEDK